MNKKSLEEDLIRGSITFPFACYEQEFLEKRKITDYHWHHEVEWIYVVEGEFHIEIDMIHYHIKEKSMIIIQSQALHRLWTNKHCKYYAFVFDMGLIRNKTFDVCETEYFQPIEKGEIVFKNYIGLEDSLNDSIENNLVKLVQLSNARGEFWQLECKILLLQILCSLLKGNHFEKKEEAHDAKVNEQIERIKKILFYIDENLSHIIRIEELGKLANMNPNYFCKYFKKHFGITPIAYITKRRIDEAAKLLSETDLPISEVAYQTGFEHVSFFISKFKEHYKLTPKQYAIMCRRK